MLVIINCILALIFFFVFFIMLHSEPSERLLFKLNKKYLSTAKSE